MSRRRAVRIRVTGVRDVQKRLTAAGLTMDQPEVIRVMQAGAEMMADRARERAPYRTGALRSGIYTASSLLNNYVPLARRGRKLNSPLRYPPRPRQVVVVSSVYYGLILEVGGTGKRGRKRRFFRAGIRQAQPAASVYILERLNRLIEARYAAGRTIT